MPPRTNRADRLLRDFGGRLRAARITAGYESAEGLARELGMDAARYRKYERGESMPPIDVLEQMIRLFDRDADWLLFGTGKRKPVPPPRD